MYFKNINVCAFDSVIPVPGTSSKETNEQIYKYIAEEIFITALGMIIDK